MNKVYIPKNQQSTIQNLIYYQVSKPMNFPHHKQNLKLINDIQKINKQGGQSEDNKIKNIISSPANRKSLSKIYKKVKKTKLQNSIDCRLSCQINREDRKYNEKNQQINNNNNLSGISNSHNDSSLFIPDKIHSEASLFEKYYYNKILNLKKKIGKNEQLPKVKSSSLIPNRKINIEDNDVENLKINKLNNINKFNYLNSRNENNNLNLNNNINPLSTINQNTQDKCYTHNNIKTELPQIKISTPNYKNNIYNFSQKEQLNSLNPPIPSYKYVNQFLPKINHNYLLENKKIISENKLQKVVHSDQKDEQNEPLLHKNYGKTPQYLLKFKEDEMKKKEDEKIANELKNYPKGTKLLSDNERMETLQNLLMTRNRMEDLLEKMPITNRSLSVTHKRADLENKLRELDKSIELFSKKKVFIKE